MIKRIWKVIALFGSMVLLCGCGKEKLSDEEILQKINTAGKCGENLEWQLYDGAFGITLEIGGNGQMDDYSEETVPWKAGKKYILDFAIGEGVSSLGENALNGCEKLKWVCLPEGVVTIGNNAFDKCVNIWDIDLPDSIQSIGDEAFKDCHKLRQIELPENLTYLGSGTFDNCTALEEILIPVPNEEETICVNLKGEKVLSIEYELDEAFRDGWLSLGRAYSDEDANVYHYIEKYATSESDWDGQDTTEYIEESSADTNIQNGENNQEETNTTTQDTNISTENTTEYILPDSDSRYISENELGGMSSEQLRLARNEIFARHGRKFKDAQLQEYFNTKSWYSPQYDADSFDENMEQILNQYELKNADVIKTRENEVQ